MNGEGHNWSDEEIDLIVAEYFVMRNMELAGTPFVKSHRNAALQESLKRSPGSIEYKHQNISAVLMVLGEPWIRGYKPARNFQKALVDGVERYLEARMDANFEFPVGQKAFNDEGVLYVGPAPTSKSPQDENHKALRRIVRKFDPAARDARNRELGYQGEERVLRSEQSLLRSAGRNDLARRVRWVSQMDGDGAGYDIRSFEPGGRERFLEVKTTIGHELTPFYLTANEHQFSQERPDGFELFRVYDFATDPKAFTVRPPLEDFLVLRTANYKASFS